MTDYLPRKMGPLAGDHPTVTDRERCPGCDEMFIAGDYVTLVVIGPGDDPEKQELARTGRPYTGVAICAHWSCVTGEPA